jgi:steroid 5-alpha reductase family enzyme
MMADTLFPEWFYHTLYGSDINVIQLADSCLYIMLAAALICFLVSEITRNYSQVDKLWSLLPVVYSIVAVTSFPSPRLLIMSILVIAWGLRLSYNLFRKGGYNIIPWKGEEDYRWKILRQHPLLKGRIRFGLFNLLFIAFYQNLLIFLFSSPLLIAAHNRDSGLNLLDLAAALLMLLFIIIETMADNQQYRFQLLKRRMAAANSNFQASLKQGFISEGLWRHVRHPNFISEQAIWISFYLFGVAASGKLINWTISGPILLVFLFIGSTRLTENISSKKYAGYEAYQKEVPKFIPVLFRSAKK